MPTATGITRTSSAGYGGHARLFWPATVIGLLIVMATGRGVHLTAGRGSVMSRGDGLPITMADGFITTITGRGVRGVFTIAVAAGGGRRWWHFTSPSETTSVGIRCLTIIAIRGRVITTGTIETGETG